MARKSSEKNLVIVESPAKAKTINKYLGDDFVVKASMGHVRDLPSKGMGVDLKTFVPDYEVLSSRDKVIAELRKLAKSSDHVYLATDLDREGEAIAWHLKEALNIPDKKASRVIFNAITRSEIQKAFQNPHQIDINRVNAQQARRILDRIVGYEISPLLWRKVARGLSAGRVQSVAVRLVVEREREIERFIPEEHWKIGGVFTTDLDEKRGQELTDSWNDFLNNTGNGERTKAEKDKWLAQRQAFVGELVELAGQKFDAGNKDQAIAAAKALGFAIEQVLETEDSQAKGPAQHLVRIKGRVTKAPPCRVRDIETKRTSVRPSAPFITSTLQQGASSRLSFGAQRTMRIAQTLYEAGHITYMRTDSTNLSAEALTMARSYIQKTFGEQYLPEKPNFFSSSNKSAQEAHEAIRPTDASFNPQLAHGKLGPDEYKLYQLIWNRFVACQMPPAQFDQTGVNIQIMDSSTGKSANSSAATPVALFRATGRKLVFDGFMRVAGISSEDQLLPEMKQGQALRAVDFDPTQHFSQPPARFSEASLVKELERLGIGRPSTYANIIQTIQDRQYVSQINRRFYATMLGCIVTDKLIQGFPKIMEVGFTADMESKLDSIEEQHMDWVKLLRDFYGPFHENVEGAMEKIDHAGGTPSPYTCPTCGKPMVYRISKTGFFLACSDRECKQTMPVDEQGKPKTREVSAFHCPSCGRPMIKRRGRFGEFLGCSGYSEKNEQGEPACTVIINLDKQGNPLPPKPKPIKTGIKCEKCGSPMLLRDSKRGPFLGCSSFPKCRSTKMVKKLEGEDLKQVEALLPQLKEASLESQQLITKLRAEAGLPAAEAAASASITTDIDCEECGKPMVIRSGRRGKFLACSGYPKCRATAEVPAKLLEELDGAKNSTPGGAGKKKTTGDEPASDNP
ncbi:MAG: type I DNA topoisomerase [Phycisphaerales bacterium]|nr:type I DNA topoisomerase [Phycisphaerales bacterium]